jgi:hypothetical protein
MVKGYINAYDIDAGDINAWNIDAWDISAGDINAWDINARNINAKNIRYYAVCFAYQNIKCKSIKGERENSKHFCLDGEIIIKDKTDKSELREELIKYIDKKLGDEE